MTMAENDDTLLRAGGSLDPGSVPRLTCYPLEPESRRRSSRPARRATGWTETRPALCLSLHSAVDRQCQRVGDPVARWNSRRRGPAARCRRALSISTKDDRARVDRLAVSHFGHGVLTLIPGYLFRTSPGWALWVRGSPNTAKRNLVRLEGLVETDWLDFPFTMNWRFTRPGTVQFERGEPFCFMTRWRTRCSTGSSPRSGRSKGAGAEGGIRGAREGRGDFNARLAARDPEPLRGLAAPLRARRRCGRAHKRISSLQAKAACCSPDMTAVVKGPPGTRP